MKPASDARRRAERGAVLVEMALVMPILCAFLVTIVDLGLMLREYQILQNAVREAARYSVHPLSNPLTPTYSEAQIKARVLEYMQQNAGIPAVSATSVSVVHDAPILVDGLTIYGSRVTATYSRNLLITGDGFLPLPAVTLSASTVFRNLY